MLLKLEDGSEVHVYFKHILSPDPHPRTFVKVVENGAVVDLDTAWCHPDDQFNKFVGRKIALRRALENVPRERRTLIWKAYGKYTGAF